MFLFNKAAKQLKEVQDELELLKRDHNKLVLESTKLLKEAQLEMELLKSDNNQLRSKYAALIDADAVLAEKKNAIHLSETALQQLSAKYQQALLEQEEAYADKRSHNKH